MKRLLKTRLVQSVLFLGLVLAVLPSVSNAEKGYGSISGTFILKGDIPKTEFVIKNGILVDGGLKPKDPTVCAAGNLKSDSLVIDPKTKGIGNIFIYLRKAPQKIHPMLVKPPETKLEFNQKGCRFFPHAMFVRAGQTVNVRTSDNCAHNTHTYPLRNEAENFVVPANTKIPVPLVHEVAEILPMKVGCDIHPWMSAYWLIMDHPYAAVTVAKLSGKKGEPLVGSFKIDKLPVGDYEFRVWHERVGYVSVDKASRRGFMVTIKGDVKRTFEVPVEKFSE